MAKQQPIDVFMPPNILKAKVGGNGSLDFNAIKRAEAAVAALKKEFAVWIADDVDRLVAARDAYEKDSDATHFDALYRVAHDLKGQGTTFDFPLVSRVAASLCTLTEGSGNGTAVPVTLIDAHVNAIKVIVRDEIKDPDDPTAANLAKELEAQVAQLMDKPPA